MSVDAPLIMRRAIFGKLITEGRKSQLNWKNCVTNRWGLPAGNYEIIRSSFWNIFISVKWYGFKDLSLPNIILFNKTNEYGVFKKGTLLGKKMSAENINYCLQNHLSALIENHIRLRDIEYVFLSWTKEITFRMKIIQQQYIFCGS